MISSLYRPSLGKTVALVSVVMSPCLFGSLPVLAEQAATGTDARQLREELQERDKIIADLLKRVGELEQRIGDDRTRPGPARSPVPASTATTTSPPAQVRAASPSSTPAPAPSPAPASGPGAVDVDELAAERALERTLTSEGALLLPPKGFEVEPYFSYKRRVSSGPTLVQEGGAVLARSFEVRRNEFDVGIRARFGLPYDTQIEVDLPYRRVEQSALIPSGISAFNKVSNTGSSLGDIKLGIAKTLLRESEWRPDLVGRLTWDTDTGDAVDSDVGLGIGFNELRASLVALKRQDPIAFTASLAYTTAFEKQGIEPGDEVGFLLGASLAASPGTSLSLALAQAFTEETKLNSRKVVGSDQVSGSLLLGFSSIIGRQTLLSLTVAVGLTDDAPDYGVNLSLPIRF